MNDSIVLRGYKSTAEKHHQYIQKDVIKKVLSNEALFSDEWVIKSGTEIPWDIRHPRRKTDAIVQRFYKNDSHLVHDSCSFEVKISTADLRSGCGMNFIDLYNYLVVPSEILHDAIKYLRKYDDYYHHVGIISFKFPHHYLLVRECEINTEQWQDIADLQENELFIYSKCFE